MVFKGKEKENGRKLETTNKEGQFIFDIQDIRKAGTTYYKVYEKLIKRKQVFNMMKLFIMLKRKLYLKIIN